MAEKAGLNAKCICGHYKNVHDHGKVYTGCAVPKCLCMSYREKA